MKWKLKGYAVAMGLVVLWATSGCGSDMAEELAEDACDQNVECGFVHSSNYGACVDDLEQGLRRLRDHSTACWNAGRDSINCEMDLSCLELGDHDSVEAECGDIYDEVEAECPGLQMR